MFSYVLPALTQIQLKTLLSYSCCNITATDLGSPAITAPLLPEMCLYHFSHSPHSRTRYESR